MGKARPPGSHAGHGAFVVAKNRAARTLPGLEVWCAKHVQFDNRLGWQQQLRLELRSRLKRLAAREGEYLKATVFGATNQDQRPRNAAIMPPPPLMLF